MPNDLMKLVASVLAQKRALDEKERQLIDSLNRVLPDMGYRVVPMSNGGGPIDAGGLVNRATVTRSRRPGVKALVCQQCGRRFGHPLHLGRHTAAMHKGASAKSAKASRPRRRRKRSRQAARAKSS